MTGAVIYLADRMAPDDWARAQATAGRLLREERERLAIEAERERIWRDRPRAPEPMQEAFRW